MDKKDGCPAIILKSMSNPSRVRLPHHHLLAGRHRVLLIITDRYLRRDVFLPLPVLNQLYLLDLM